MPGLSHGTSDPLVYKHRISYFQKVFLALVFRIAVVIISPSGEILSFNRETKRCLLSLFSVPVMPDVTMATEDKIDITQ